MPPDRPARGVLVLFVRQKGAVDVEMNVILSKPGRNGDPDGFGNHRSHTFRIVHHTTPIRWPGVNTANISTPRTT